MRLKTSIIVVVLLLGSMSSLHASKRILVDLSHQIAIAYQDGKVRFFGRISTGKPGRETPTGSYFVREKDIDHVSNLWPQPNGGAKMYYMLRITRDGVAMHLGNTPDYPASHGCIRMQNGFAQQMFGWAEKWTKVDIIGTPPTHSPAVALPAYAQNARILRRSIGGGNANPLSILSHSPKVDETLPLLVASDVETNMPSRREALPHHIRPLAVISSNPKHQAISKKTASYSVKRRTRKSRIRRDPHPNPLKAVSGD